MESAGHLGRSCRFSESLHAAIARICSHWVAGSNAAGAVWTYDNTTVITKDNHVNEDQAESSAEKLHDVRREKVVINQGSDSSQGRQAACESGEGYVLRLGS